MLRFVHARPKSKYLAQYSVKDTELDFISCSREHQIQIGTWTWATFFKIFHNRSEGILLDIEFQDVNIIE